jgi:hypothetical protein
VTAEIRLRAIDRIYRDPCSALKYG